VIFSVPTKNCNFNFSSTSSSSRLLLFFLTSSFQTSFKSFFFFFLILSNLLRSLFLPLFFIQIKSSQVYFFQIFSTMHFSKIALSLTFVVSLASAAPIMVSFRWSRIFFSSKRSAPPDLSALSTLPLTGTAWRGRRGQETQRSWLVCKWSRLRKVHFLMQYLISFLPKGIGASIFAATAIYNGLKGNGYIKEAEEFKQQFGVSAP